MMATLGVALRGSTLKRYMEFIWYRALAEIKADVSRGFLGFAWWIIEPVMYMGAFYVIFGLIFRQRGADYVPFLLCGLVVWKWFDSAIRNASTSITHNMWLIYQVYLPKMVFPVIATLISTLRFALVFSMLLLFLLASGLPVTAAWFTGLPLLLLLQVALILGLAMIFAAIVPFIPDVKFLIDNCLLLLFFLSGIFFRFDAIPASLRPFFDLNPMAVIIHGYREILIAGQPLDWQALWPVVLMSAGFITLGVALLSRWDRIYPKKAFL